ncbi:alpha/beta hydrolase [Lentzea sp. NBRC 105346]|uniref:alpha/beta hydrolase n=1 Tax=Lentzea sp. NBRC 105346 TaxID=3032205 RepID=UPI0024A11140|nr:alpha/beta hydrolase [Lentzea sp. NBRC 105346]GLZ31245.1 alpha/beta hydrolase [Lentzea sp. NBRC 105346]
MTEASEDTRTLPLGGEVVATLLRRRPATNTRGAILYVHGFADYFFQDHVADHFTAQGYDFYAIDLRGYGRSLRDGTPPNYVTDMSVYFEELDAAVKAIRQDDGHEHLVVLGHSTGGLTTSLWAHARRADKLIDALVLNSPWFDVPEPPPIRRLVRFLGRVAPKLVIRPGLGDVYGKSIHSDHKGEWAFDLTMKPLAGFPVLAGWIRAILIAQQRLQQGLDVPVPVLVLHSDRSMITEKEWSEDVMKVDAVLEVEHMKKWAPGIGKDVTVVEVPGGLHDLFLSPEAVRTRAFDEVDKFLAEKTA